MIKLVPCLGITYINSLGVDYSTTRLWNILPNEAVLAVKKDPFIALAKKNYVVNDHY